MMEFLRGFVLMVLFYIAGAIILVTLRALFKPSTEIFRKMLHVLCFIAIFPWMAVFEHWYFAAAGMITFSVLVLILMKYLPWFKAIFPQRSENEVETSQVEVFLIMAFLVFIFWGILGDRKYIISTVLMAHCFGDAAAALGGKAYGKHKIHCKLVEGTKSWEGSSTMFGICCIVIMIMLSIYQVASFPYRILVTIIVALVATIAEMLSHKGADTFLVPCTSAVVLYLLMHVI